MINFENKKIPLNIIFAIKFIKLSPLLIVLLILNYFSFNKFLVPKLVKYNFYEITLGFYPNVDYLQLQQKINNLKFDIQSSASYSFSTSLEVDQYSFLDLNIDNFFLKENEENNISLNFVKKFSDRPIRKTLFNISIPKNSNISENIFVKNFENDIVKNLELQILKSFENQITIVEDTIIQSANPVLKLYEENLSLLKEDYNQYVKNFKNNQNLIKIDLIHKKLNDNSRLFQLLILFLYITITFYILLIISLIFSKNIKNFYKGIVKYW